MLNLFLAILSLFLAASLSLLLGTAPTVLTKALSAPAFALLTLVEKSATEAGDLLVNGPLSLPDLPFLLGQLEKFAIVIYLNRLSLLRMYPKPRPMQKTRQGPKRSRPKLVNAAIHVVAEAAKQARPGTWLLLNGWGAKELKNNGIAVAKLKKIKCSCGELVALGFTVRDVVEARYSPAEIKKHFNISDFSMAGYDAKQLKARFRYSAADLKSIGFKAVDLIRAGFKDAELIAAGFREPELSAPHTFIRKQPYMR